MEAVFESIFSTIDAFIYRCRNDADYTMEYMQGGVEALVGYRPDEMIGNRVASWVEIVLPEDTQLVYSTVDDCIEKNEPWDFAYRVVHKKGHPVWIRERGKAIFENGELAYLEGLIVCASAETELRDQRENLLAHTKQANEEILTLSAEIAHSVRQLSFLSVNARIEAARSGEAGRGFAVIANEIKSLADENGRLADKITDKIKSDEPGGTGHMLQSVSQ